MARKTVENPLKSGHRPPKTSLTPAQDRALIALLASRSIAAAARAARLSESTLRRWLRDHEPFQTRLRQLREEALGHAALRLQQRAGDAVETLFDSIASNDRIESGRAAMLRTALDFAFRAASYTDLADRIADLEDAVPDSGASGSESASGDNDALDLDDSTQPENPA